jgi:hypothetical protein
MTMQPPISNFRQSVSSVLTNRRTAEERSVSPSVTIDRRTYTDRSDATDGGSRDLKCALELSEVSTTRRMHHGKKA